MAKLNRFNSFTKQQEANLKSETEGLYVQLTNIKPNPSNKLESDLPKDLKTENGYTSGGVLCGIWSVDEELVIASKAIIASGGSIGAFRYAVLFSKNYLIGWIDYGDSIYIKDKESLIVDFRLKVD